MKLYQLLTGFVIIDYMGDDTSIVQSVLWKRYKKVLKSLKNNLMRHIQLKKNIILNFIVG